MKELRFLDELVQRYPVLEPVKGDILKAYEIMRDCYEKGGKLMIACCTGSLFLNICSNASLPLRLSMI